MHVSPPMQKPSTSRLLQIVASLIAHRELIWAMTKREIVGRYRGSILGVAWSFFHPILMLTVYTFVFSVAFKARWAGGSESKTEFALLLFTGMIIHGLFAECVARAPALILGNVNYVKKVVFPLEILPCVALGAALFHMAISIGVLLAFYVVINHSIQWTVIFLPLVIAPLIIVTLGVSWFLASLGVFLRDTGQIIGVVLTMMMFVSPVFYPVSALPENYQIFIMLNPLTFIMEQARDVVIWGKLPNWYGLLIYTGASLVVAKLGFAWFQKTRKWFADVL